MDGGGKNQKKVVFYDTEKRHAELKVRLHYDGLTQTGFFRSIITGYIEKDEILMEYLSKVKEELSTQGKTKRTASQKLYEKGNKLKNEFALDSGELENIFDILEEEHPDL